MCNVLSSERALGLSSLIHLHLKWHWGGHAAYIMLIVSSPSHAHTPHPPLVLWFMLLFHVLSRICGICNTSKWGMVPICLSPVWVDLCTEGVGYSKWQKPATSLAHIFLFLSGDHQGCYPDVTERIIFPGHQPLGPIAERRSAEKLLHATLSSTSPAVSFSLRGSSCLISADVCHHFFFFISFHLNRFDLKDLFCPPPASMNTWNTCTCDLWPPLFAVRLSRAVKSCKWVSSVWKMIFFFSHPLNCLSFRSIAFIALELQFSLRMCAKALLPIHQEGCSTYWIFVKDTVKLH